jgi:hypothetical protein
MPDDALRKRDFASYALALGLLAVAASIAYFAYEVAQIREQVPEILAQMESTSQEIGPVVKEVGAIRDLIPPILEEIAATREAIPPVLAEVAATREAIPPVLAEVAQTREQLPGLYASVNTASQAITETAREVEALRPMIPDMLSRIDAATAEMQATRESVPPTLDRVDLMIERARIAGQEASEGAVTGIFRGILKAPFRLVGGVGGMVAPDADAAKHFTDRDYELMREAAIPLSEGSEGLSRSWDNPDSDVRGTLTLVEIDLSGDRECRELKNLVWKGTAQIYDDVVTLCENEEGVWSIAGYDSQP